ncbi:suppressor of hpr1 [Tulasnella sp. 418]|nr:suppressor of hpr1 [Tulasnella sp. 418]
MTQPQQGFATTSENDLLPQPIVIDTDSARNRNRELFELELEFVQALGNPFYLYNLAVEGYMDDPAFVNYLKYLTYWQDKEYARFIMYPHALHHLDLLQNARFREALKKPETQSFLQHHQFEHWRTWRVRARPPTLPPLAKAGDNSQGKDNEALNAGGPQ